MLGRASNMSKVSRTSNLDQENYKKMWDNPFYVVFIKDGCQLTDPKAKSIKVDIAAFIRKYQIKPPKFIARLPEDYIKAQQTFY